MSRVLTVRPVDEAFLVAAGSLDGLNVSEVLGQLPVPPAGENRPTMPYAIVYRIAWEGWSGPPGEPLADGPICYQVTVVDGNLLGAQEWADRLRSHLLGRSPATGAYLTPITPVGVKVLHRRSLSTGTPDSDATVSQVSDRYVLDCTMGA